MFKKMSVLILLFLLSSCGFSTGYDFLKFAVLGQKISLKTRLEEFKGKKWSLFKPVTVSWSKHSVPFIDAQTDRDLFYVTGLIQAHLRGTQLEIFRKLSQGRMTELAGKKAFDMDVFLRTIDLGKKHQEIADSLPEDIKDHVKAFVRGINDYNDQREKLPLDLKMLGVSKIEPWTLKDLIYVHRLMGSDVNWKFFPHLAQIWSAMGEDEFTPYWKKWVTPFFKKDSMDIEDIDKFTEAGSNAYVVSGKKTQSGSPLVAGDPHLGITIPNFWLFMHQRSPSFNTLGIAMPSFPVAAMGRSEHLSWTGTNLWAKSAYLIELSDEDLNSVTTRTEVFKVRFGKDKKVEVRESKYGPILSDTPFLSVKKPLSLYWAGHEVSKEIESFFKANQAKTVDEFKKAFKDYGVVGLSYVVGSESGEIDRIHVGKIPTVKKSGFIQKSDEVSSGFIDVDDYVSVKNTESGFLVSANEKVRTKKGFHVCSMCSAGERKKRIEELIDKKNKIDVNDVKKIQEDVYSEDAKTAVDRFFKVFGAHKVRLPQNFEALLKWDFKYEIAKDSPYFFEKMMSVFIKLVQEKRGLSERQNKFELSHYSWREKVFRAFDELNDESRKDILKRLSKKVDALRSKKWGEVHKLKPAHFLSSIPLIGCLFSFKEYGYPGGVSTVMKASFKEGTDDFTVKFGAHLRVIFDLSEENENYGVMIGGQDGFLGSSALNDQTSLWIEGAYMKLPFDQKGIDEISLYKTVLR